MSVSAIHTVCFEQPAVPIHAGRFAGKQEIVLTVVRADNGLEGYSMARTHGGQSGEGLAQAIVKSLAPRVLGQDPLARERIWQAMLELEPAGYVPVFAISALDVALWDLAGKILGVPLYRLLGGRRDRMLAYASSATLASIDDYLREVERCREQGYRAYKIHPFNVPARDVELCRAVRQAVGPDFTLMLDVAKSYDRASALRVGRVLQELDFAWYEEPLPQHDIQGYAELCRALEIPVIGAETVPGHAQAVANYLRADALDMVLCDVYWKAGVSGMVRTASLCESMGIKVASHHAASPLMNVANLHVLCGMSNADFIEILVPEAGYDFALHAYLAPDSEGYVQAPVAPGLGVELDWDYIKRHRTPHGNLATPDSAGAGASLGA
jgi:L-alanine-DL-glutamate epimerase-like enolase superfamily enzyme